MLMKVKHRYLVGLKNVLERPDDVFEGPVPGAIRYMVSRNYKIAKEEVDSILQEFPIAQEYMEYQGKRTQIFRDAKVETDPQFFALPEEERAEINKRLADLDEEYKDAISAEREMSAAREEFLDQELEVNLYTVKPDALNLKEPNGWQAWNILFNDGNGIIRED